jgi:hypothetical protein
VPSGRLFDGVCLCCASRVCCVWLCDRPCTSGTVAVVGVLCFLLSLLLGCGRVLPPIRRVDSPLCVGSHHEGEVRRQRPVQVAESAFAAPSHTVVVVVAVVVIYHDPSLLAI